MKCFIHYLKEHLRLAFYAIVVTFITITVLSLSMCQPAHAFQSSPKSYHMIADFNSCEPSLLNDKLFIQKTLEQAALSGGYTILKSMSHQFKPQGVTALLMLTESHLSIHTWPETGFAAVDLFTCGENRPDAAVKYIQEQLQCQQSDIVLLERRNDFKSIEPME